MRVFIINFIVIGIRGTAMRWRLLQADVLAVDWGWPPRQVPVSEGSRRGDCLGLEVHGPVGRWGGEGVGDGKVWMRRTRGTGMKFLSGEKMRHSRKKMSIMSRAKAFLQSDMTFHEAICLARQGELPDGFDQWRWRTVMDGPWPMWLH
jgi:hypothetical protein